MPRSGKHTQYTLAGTPHWEFLDLPGTGVFFRALSTLIPNGTALYLEGSQLSPATRRALAERAEWQVTVAPPGEGWPEWYDSLRLRPTAGLFGQLAEFADRDGAAGLGTAGALFQDCDLLAAWRASKDGVEVDRLEIAGTLAPARVERFARILGARAAVVPPAP